MLKVLFAGSPEVAVPSLRMLAEDTEHFEVVAVLTRPDAPTGRGRKLVPNPVKQAALELGLPVIESDPSEETFVNELTATGAQPPPWWPTARSSSRRSWTPCPWLVQPAFLAVAAMAWRRSGAAFHLGRGHFDRRHGVPHRQEDGCRPDSGAIHRGNRCARNLRRTAEPFG